MSEKYKIRDQSREYYPVELMNKEMTDEKMDYINQNPVKAGIVDEPSEYRYSCARDYYKNEKGLLDIKPIE